VFINCYCGVSPTFFAPPFRRKTSSVASRSPQQKISVTGCGSSSLWDIGVDEIEYRVLSGTHRKEILMLPMTTCMATFVVSSIFKLLTLYSSNVSKDIVTSSFILSSFCKTHLTKVKHSFATITIYVTEEISNVKKKHLALLRLDIY